MTAERYDLLHWETAIEYKTEENEKKKRKSRNWLKVRRQERKPHIYQENGEMDD